MNLSNVLALCHCTSLACLTAALFLRWFWVNSLVIHSLSIYHFRSDNEVVYVSYETNLWAIFRSSCARDSLTLWGSYAMLCGFFFGVVLKLFAWNAACVTSLNIIISNTRRLDARCVCLAVIYPSYLMSLVSCEWTVQWSVRSCVFRD